MHTQNIKDKDVNKYILKKPTIPALSLSQQKYSKNISFFNCSKRNYTQQHLFINRQPPQQRVNSDQNNFYTSNSGLSFQSYSKNNGINYSQQQSLLQVSKNVVGSSRSEATIPLKHCKLKSSLSSSSSGGGKSNSENTSSSVVVDATSSFSTSHPPKRTSTTSCTNQTADKAFHDSSRNNSNLGISSSTSHEITLSKDDDDYNDDMLEDGIEKFNFKITV